MRSVNLLVVSAAIVISSMAQGQSYNAPIEPVTHLQLEPLVAVQTLRYQGVDSDPNYSWEVERKLLGVGIYIPLAPAFSLDFNGGLSFDSRINEWSRKGDGYYLGAGVDWLAIHNNTLGLTAYLKVDRMAEKWKPTLYTQTVLDGHIGGILTFSPNTTFFPYVGADFVPYSEGDIGEEHHFAYPYDRVVNVEREKDLMLRLGALIKLSSLSLRPEVILIGEQTFQFGLLVPM